MKILNLSVMSLAVLSLISCHSQKQLGESSKESLVAKNNLSANTSQTPKATPTPQADKPSSVEDTSANLRAVQKDGKWGYINPEGKIVVPHQFNVAGPFSEGMASVKKGDKWGYINSQGKFVVEPKFDDALPFSGGLAAVQMEDNSGYIDQTGNLVINSELDYNLNFSGIVVGEKGVQARRVSKPRKKR